MLMDYEIRDLREVDTIGRKLVSVDCRVFLRRTDGAITFTTDAGWMPGPTVPAGLWREYQRADRKFKSAEKKWCAADAKVTRAYKASRYIIVNHLYDEAVDGAKYDTWMNRLRKWQAAADALWPDYQSALTDRERLLTEIAGYNAQ